MLGNQFAFQDSKLGQLFCPPRTQVLRSCFTFPGFKCWTVDLPSQDSKYWAVELPSDHSKKKQFWTVVLPFQVSSVGQLTCFPKTQSIGQLNCLLNTFKKKLFWAVVLPSQDSSRCSVWAVELVSQDLRKCSVGQLF